jgi:hypothetical protein
MPYDPYNVQNQQIDRQRQMAQAIMGQSLAPQHNQNLLTGIARILAAKLSGDRMGALDTQQQGLADQYKQSQQNTFKGVTEALRGSPEVVPFSPETPFPAQPQAAVPPDRAKALALLLQSDNPQYQNVALSGMLEKPERVKLGYGETLIDPNSQNVIAQGQSKPRTSKLLTPDELKQQLAIAGEEARITSEAGSARKLQELKDKAALEKQQNAPKAESNLTAAQSKTGMLSDLIAKAKTQANFWSTGFMGQKLADVGGTPAHDLAGTLSTIKANIGFDKLQEMRANSPTGGALGNVSDNENKLLQSVWGALMQSQTEDQFKQNLDLVDKQVKESWDRINKAYQADYGVPIPGYSGESISPEQQDAKSRAAEEGFSNLGKWVEGQGFEVLDENGQLIGYYD